MRHNPAAAILDMALAIRRLDKVMADRSLRDLEEDGDLQLVVFALSVMLGEAATRVPLEIQLVHSDLPWRKVIDFRNRMIHGYDSIEWHIVFSIIQDELPAVRTKLAEILNPKEEG
jgi:uncharacterized protein with HEPN domain